MKISGMAVKVEEIKIAVADIQVSPSENSQRFR